MGISRLSRLAALAFAGAALLSPLTVSAQNWTNGVSVIGELKYPPNFSHFDYVNPAAPKGGVLKMSELGTFDSLNLLVGKGNFPSGVGLVYDTLLKRSLDEPFSGYGLLAESISYPDDFSWASFRINPKARWADGEKITPEDVIFSLDSAKATNPRSAVYYQHVVKAEKVGDNEVKFTFDQKNNRELSSIIGQQLPIMPKHWWQGVDAKGKKRNISQTTLEPVMGSGPYKIVGVTPGSVLRLELRDDYWAKDLPVNIGQNNFKTIEYTFFADRDVEFEAFRGGALDFWQENSAKRWATAYDFPAAVSGQVKKLEVENDYRDQGVMVGFLPNIRREQFKDERVREALNYAFDFETLNRTIFYGQYQRVSSYFYGTELASSGLPKGKELEILTALKDKVPPSVFTEEYKNPVAGDQTKLRANLRQALTLFKAAGYELRGGKMVNAKTGKPFTFEILLDGNIIEKVALPFAANLRQIGVTATVRSVDSSQFTERWRKRDYDVIYQAWGESLNPGNEQAEYWGSKSAATEGTQNYVGISDTGVDALIQQVIFAPDRDTQVAAVHALDRVLLHHHYVVPTYTTRKARFAFWDKFERPKEFPYYSSGFPTIWWAKQK